MAGSVGVWSKRSPLESWCVPTTSETISEQRRHPRGLIPSADFGSSAHLLGVSGGGVSRFLPSQKRTHYTNHCATEAPAGSCRKKTNLLCAGTFTQMFPLPLGIYSYTWQFTYHFVVVRGWKNRDLKPEPAAMGLLFCLPGP